MKFTHTSAIVGSLLAAAACGGESSDGGGESSSSNGVVFGADGLGMTETGDTVAMGASMEQQAQAANAPDSQDNVLITADEGQEAGNAVNEDNPDNIEECASADQPTALKGVVLSFVFDVSASMGSHMFPYFSRELKWEPVVAATKTFFADPASEGISATLTFFPNELAELQGGEADNTATDPADPMMPAPGGFQVGGGGFSPGGPKCDVAEYTTPDVSLTELPSDTFGSAIDAVTPPDDASWRVGTPTLAALEGTIEAINSMAAQDPNMQYSIVLVTDGMPALCDGNGDDSVQPVINAVRSVADNIPTYVIGVENPAIDGEMAPPDSVSGLHDVAEAGGTGQAFLINTDDPTQTTSELGAIIAQIRENSFTCTIPIPAAPPGEQFDPELVNVIFNDGTQDVPYYYDPECAGDSGWHFDDANNPTNIQVCGNVCESLRNAEEAFVGQLKVQFGCERLPDPIIMK